MARKVSTVYRGDVRRLENAKITDVVPVVEVAAIASHSLERSEHMLESLDHPLQIDEPEIERHYNRKALESNVRGRRAAGDYRLRVFLEIVRSEPVRTLGDEVLEEVPVELRIP